jgi:membrane protein DedA with SNARE-associated domain
VQAQFGHMLDNLLDIIKNSPGIAYAIVLFGAMIEGETIILSASALAAAGYLSITKVGAIAFFSTLFVDQVLFYVGHYMYKHPGRPISERYPRLYQKSKRAVLLLKKYDTWFILSFRFIYGIRAISPVVIGLCGSLPRRFIPLNVASAMIWMIVSCGAGYCLGDFFFDARTGHIVDSSMHKLQAVVVGIIVVAILIATTIKLWGKRVKS